MTLVTLRPDSTVSAVGGTLVGAATVHAAWSDDSDASYYTMDATGDNATVTLGDLTLPAGAVIKSITARLRTAWIAGPGSNIQVLDSMGNFSAVVVGWSAPSTVTWYTKTQAGITEAAIDAATLNAYLLDGSGGRQVRVHEAFFDVTYVAVPVVSADLPTGTLTDTNLPTVVWSNTLDSSGDAQTHYQVRLFTDAQYGAGGFDPATSTATIDTGEIAGAAVSWQVTQTLPDDTYRAYVRVAQTVNGLRHWSAYDFAEFTIDVDLPGTPTFAATADNANARIALAITNVSGVASTDAFELQRSLDGGVTWGSVRTLDAGGFVDVPFVVAVGELADAADSTTHDVPLPTPPGGILTNDLLIAVSGMDGNPTLAWPASWTEIKDEAGNGSAVRAGVAWKRADGGETGTIAVTTSASEGGGTRILCIRGASTVTAPEVSAGVSSAAANANPDSLNPSGWATEPTLWIAAMVLDGNVAVTAGPAGYFNFGNTRWANASGAGVATAELLSVAASADPGAFTHVLEDSRAFTIAVRPRNPNLTVWDYEAPNGTTVHYRVRSLHDYSGVWAASDWVADLDAWTSTDWWLKHPNLPDLNVVARIRSFQSAHRTGRQGVFQPLGSPSAIVVSDTRGPATGTITFRLDTLLEQSDLDALLDTRDTLLLQSPPGQGGPDYVCFMDQDRVRIVDRPSAARVFDANTFVAVESPIGDVVAWP